MKKYDVIIIGSGQAGNPLARAMAQEGKKTLIIEKRYVGGTCVNDGCTPTKTMIASSRIAWLVANSKRWGITINGKITPDLKAIKQKKDEVVSSFRDGSIKSLEQPENLELLMGNAQFTGRKQLEVTTPEGKLQVSAEFIFIDAGTTPQIPDIPGLKDYPYLTSTTLLDLEEIPKELIILGAGYVALELGQLYSRLGTKVTILEQHALFLPKEDRDIAQCLFDILTEEGLHIQLNAKTIAVTVLGTKGVEISYQQNKKNNKVAGTHLLVATGRKPQTKELQLNLTGVETDEKGYIKVNGRLETNIKGIYALGDIKGGPAFTHIAYNDYVIVSQNLLKNKRLNTQNRLTPYVMFTDPQLGRVGITEEEAKKSKLAYQIATLPMEKVARAIEVGETRGMMKAIIDKNTDRILGAAIIGTEGGEIMSALQVAIMGKVTATEIRYGVFAHPTYTESLENLFMTVKD